MISLAYEVIKYALEPNYDVVFVMRQAFEVATKQEFHPSKHLS